MILKFDVIRTRKLWQQSIRKYVLKQGEKVVEGYKKQSKEGLFITEAATKENFTIYPPLEKVGTKPV